MKDDAVIKDNEAVYLLNEQTYLHLRENLAGVGYEVFDKNSPLPVEEGQIPREALGNTQRRIETARAYYLAEHQDEPVGRIQNVAVTTLEKFRSGVRKRRNLAPRSLPENDVRFIDPMYNELFRVPDGGVVQMTYPDGHQRSEVVEYLDDYHMKIGSSVQHICEFAERMARSRAIVEPEPLTQQDCRAWNLEYDYYLTVQAEDGAWNYALYQGDCCLLERGKIDAPELMIEEVRDEILHLFMEYIRDGERSILMSSHITSDLEKIADCVTFIDNGRILLTGYKDEILESHGILKCSLEEAAVMDPADIISVRTNAYGAEVLVPDRESARYKYRNAILDPASIDDVMLFYVHKGERAWC